MNKEGFWKNIDPKVVGRYALGGGLTGASIAAALDLVHMLRSMHQQRQETSKALNPETDRNTLVLTLPRKQAMIEIGPEVKEIALEGGPRKKQGRVRKDGTFTEKYIKRETQKYPKQEKDAGTAGWPTLTASVLAGVGGTVAGAALVDRIYRVQREKQLKRQLAAAQQEYLDALSGGKTAEFVENLFSIEGQEKTAESTFGMLNVPLAAMALLTILGTGASGYLTKRILDEKARETEDKLDVPPVRRIILRSAPDPDPAKQASVEEVESIAACLGVITDGMRHQPNIMAQPEIKSALVAANLSADALIKHAQAGQAGQDTLMGYLQANPQLRKLIARSYISNTSGPLSGFFKRLALATPMGRNYADKRIYGALSQFEQPKVAALLPTVNALTSAAVGGIAGSQAGDASSDELAQAFLKAQQQKEDEARLKNMKVPGTVRVEAEGEEAQKYLTANQKQIADLIKRLAAQNQI